MLNPVTNIYYFRNLVLASGPKSCNPLQDDYGLLRHKKAIYVQPKFIKSVCGEEYIELEGTHQIMGYIKHSVFLATRSCINKNALVIKYISIARYLVLVGLCCRPGLQTACVKIWMYMSSFFITFFCSNFMYAVFDLC